MIKKSTLYPLMIVLILTSSAGTINAQQANKPVGPTAVNPVVVALPAAQTGNVNYVRTWEAMGPVTDPNVMISAGYQDVKQTTQYVDGLGRPLQTVSRQITPQYKDKVAPVVYDEFGREALTYLPYVSVETNGLFKTDPFNAQQTFMQSQPQYSDEKVYYSQTEFEASPLNRVTKTMAPGNSWAGSGRGVSQAYLINTTDDAVRIWNINNNKLTYAQKDVTTNIPYNPATPASPLYNAGELNKKVVKDEAGNATIEYVDKEGLAVLKKVQVSNVAADYTGYTGFLCTYYVYDDLNQLRFVIPPKAVAALINNNWVLSADVINELCFRYEYDERGRMTAKKVPGADWVYMIYDVRDRLVFTQDGNMRKNNQWLATLYDWLNRPVLTGMMTDYAGNPDGLKDLVNSQKTIGSIPPQGMLADLILPNATQTGPFSGIYQTYNSITLDAGFESASGQDFTAEIFNTMIVDIPEESIVEGMIVNKNPLPSNTTFIALTKIYYDNYDWTNKDYKSDYNNYLDAGSNAHPVMQPTVKDTKTTGLVTGTQVRVIIDPGNLAAGNWLTSVSFYDDRSRVIQINSETLKGTDIITNRYDFTGKVLCSYLDHTNPTGTPASVHIKTNIEYDHAGRLLEVWKTIDDDVSKKALIVKNEYDELGQLKSKQLGHKKDPYGNYTTPKYDPLETLNYTYNIRGWMTGINKDYANNISNTGQGNSMFGMELNYDKGFQVPQYNGNIAGTKWRSKGDGDRRAYGYTFDQANRILGADFTQFDGTDYVDHPTIQFDMEMGNALRGLPAYDENGNIGAMNHKGLKLGNSPVIDELEYKYYKGGNKLRYVKDWARDASGIEGGDWGLGDFTDNNKNGDDYGYDVNGNMITDLNKKMIGIADIDQAGGAIVYNHLNLPWKINVEDGNKGAITYIYDAAGNKLQKITYEKGATVTFNNNSLTSDITTTTSYVGGLVYESKNYGNSSLASLNYSDKLQFIGQEEGRIRYMAAGATSAHFEYDYFVKDHLGNVRMVLTEQKDHHDYLATMESGARAVENQLFSNLDVSEYPASTAGFPGGGPEDPNLMVARVNGNTQKKGPAIVLKVMAGDVVDVGVRYLYHNKTGSLSTGNVFSEILSSLAGGIVSTSGVAKGTMAALSDPVSSPLLGALTGFRQDNNPDIPSKPKAYLNWVLVDEQFKYVNTFPQSGALPVGAAEQTASLGYSAIDITKNGYLYIYVSNETENWDVFFDDLAVTHHMGPLLEETHYYPFGLTMAGISSKGMSFGRPENKRRFNYGSELASKEFSDGSGLDWYETNFRSLDPQLGRWWQDDPHAEYHLGTTSYGYVLNNPLIYNDPMGLDTLNVYGPGKHKIKIREGDILAWHNENSVSYFLYSPNAEGGVDGFVGQGIKSQTLSPVVVKPNKFANVKSNSDESINSFSFPWLALVGTGVSTGSFLFHSEHGWYSIKQNKFYSPNFHGNQYTGGRVKSAKANSTRLTRVGIGIALWNMYDINRQYRKSEINKGQMVTEQASNAISTIGIYGAAWGVGWEAGRYITSIPWYRANIRPLIQDAFGAERDEVPQTRDISSPGSSENN